MDASPTPVAPAQPISVDTLIEIAGYLGAAVALSAAGVALEDAGTGVQIGFELATAAVLIAAGWALGEGSDVLARMKSVFWFLALAAVTGVVGVFFDEVTDLHGKALTIVAAAIVTAVALLLWWLLRRSLQLLGFFIGGLVIVGAVFFPDIDFLFGPPDLTGVGLAVWLYGWAWIAAASLKVLDPRRTAIVLGSIAAVVSPLVMQVGNDALLGQILALVSSVALVTLGDLFGERGVAGIGIAGALFVASAIVGDHVDDVGPAIVALVIGLVLLGGAIVATRTERRTPPVPPTPPMPE
jgi:hypothetical protein